jgi:hypothetical protein
MRIRRNMDLGSVRMKIPPSQIKKNIKNVLSGIGKMDVKLAQSY